jgi:hypothetical protein
MEALRAFAQVDAPPDAATMPSYAAIASGDVEPADAATAHTRYTLEHRVTTSAVPRHKAIVVTARWTDRVGEPQHVELASIVAGIDPALGGLLTLQRAAPASTAPMGRHPAIPVLARDLGDGRSVFKPSPAAGVAWVFNHASGLITSVCDAPAGVGNGDLSAAQLSNCISRVGLLVSGFVRFATDSDAPGAQDAEQPRSSALNLDLCMTSADAASCTGASLAECFDDAPAAAGTAQQVVIYHCAVFPPAGTLHWSGRLNLVPAGWALAAPPPSPPSPAGFKVCRYSFDHNANGRIDNAEHPALYTQVAAPLADQNFLVVRGAAACPVDRPVNLGAAQPDNVANDSTVQHQP